jgi:hypothetical protein
MNAVDFRIRAGVCEQMAKQTQDRDIKVQWEELAMQWHLLANQTALLAEKDK